MADENVLSALDFTPTNVIDEQAVALAVAHSVYKALHDGDLTILTTVGSIFDVRGEGPLSFGPLPAFDPAKHNTAVIVTPDGQPIVTIQAAMIVKQLPEPM